MNPLFSRVFGSAITPIPAVQLLSNGRYHVMITNAGGGYSRWKDIAVTRWREDSTRDNCGAFCYLRDVANGTFWSTTFQPTLDPSATYQTNLWEACAAFRCSKQGLDALTEIAVSPEDDIEVRRIRITNRSGARKIIDLTSYAEVVLGSAADDAAHPAYSNLFVQTEIIRDKCAILCDRRTVDHAAPWMFHLIVPTESVLADLSYETDRMRFIGRGNTLIHPQAMRDVAALSDSEGSVLDPIVAIQCRTTLTQEQSVTVAFVTGIGETRDACLTLIEKYQDRKLTNRVFGLARAHSQSVLRQLNATQADAQLYCRLADSIIYGNASLRADADILIKNRRGQSGLWGNSISGDLPIVLLQIGEPASLNFVRQVLQGHAYWRLQGVTVDLVICNSDDTDSRQALHDQITALIAAGTEADLSDKPGGIFVRLAKPLPSEDRILLQAVSRVLLDDGGGTLAEQINRHSFAEAFVPPTQVGTPHAEPAAALESSRGDLLFFNGLGGFTSDGREYVITIAPGQITPAPWVNVLANPTFGTIVSESGCANTWSENAHEFLLTPWSNDPISDSQGEAFYLRDEDSGHFWSPTPWPSGGQGHYVCRHGFGYSVFTHTEDGIDSELWVYVELDAPLKFAVLKVSNKSGRLRRLSATGYVEWVLGELRSKSMMHVITEMDSDCGALFARNPYNDEFGERITFFDVDDVEEATRSFTGDRTEFIGRNGTLLNPAARSLPRLSCKVGAALDPCAAIQVPFELVVGQEREIIFRLGAGLSDDDARQVVKRFRGSVAAQGALEKVTNYWKHTLGAVTVETPDPSINVLANGWLMYQVMACRLWGRTAFYQSSGAFGFRDQLQDVMSLVHTEPGLVRAHLLLCASRQFKEGDVQHWWHPPLGRGVRTKCSDDFLWLPLTTCRYVSSTSDTGVLDEFIHFLEGRPFKPEEESYYELPGVSDETATLYEHCARAVKRGLRFGEHGLPLMGTGDWNDGMNKVGAQGKGESIWLGFFLYHVLRQFENLAQLHGDAASVELCQNEAARLRQSIEQHGWDGEWYRRAYFDDGTPLGSASNPECKIDSISQSWSVLSGAGSADRSRMAMNALDKHLVHRNDGVIQLLTPPFDKSTPDPGYIKAYVPGVRENGAQYTHAAVWAAIAFAAIGDNRRAGELLSIINPVNHAANAESIAIYKAEPYVVASDVYALSPHTGRGGWTWYSGSAGWMYRLIVESILGLRREADKLHFEPCIPAHWTAFKMSYRYGETVYRITVSQTQGAKGVKTLTVDDVERLDLVVPLIDDRQKHEVVLKIHSAKS